MNPLNFKPARLAVLSIVAMALLAVRLHAQSAEQTISLVNGWNAVWLEVEPTYPDGHPKAGQPKSPADVFPAEVLTVISPKLLAGTAEFFAQDPTTAGTFNQAGWEQWHNPAGVDDNLALITGNRPYLVEVSGNKNFIVEGKVRFHRPVWTPDRYNLVGFGLDGSPTFNAFFGPSGTKHPVTRIFRLNSATGNWQLVTGTGLMVSNQAYWIFCSGPSDYMGPVAVEFDGMAAGRMNFGGPGDAVTVDPGIDAQELDLDELVFTNLGSTTAIPSMEQTPNLDPGAGAIADLELVAVRPKSGTIAYESVATIGSGAGLQENVAGLSSATLTMGAKRNWTAGLAARTNLYRLKTGGGGAMWLPVTALNSDLNAPTDLLVGDVSSVAGLWVGEVSVNAVSSLVVDGAPVVPAAAPAPLRLLLHSDASGAVRLLSQVTIMQTKTADPQIAPVPVLVVDQAKIPFFEGIKERNGKRVGLRLESVAFDMPRKLDAASQDALIEDPEFLLLTDLSPELQDALSQNPLTRTTAQTDLIAANTAAIDAAKSTIPSLLPGYLESRDSRPPKLVEDYQLTLPMTGAIGSGKTVQTQAGKLVLDPFHRSNPFRHAYHPHHARGPAITREITIVFDATQSVTDRLHGTYTETIQKLTKSNITLTGSIEMRRVSAVATLDTAP